MPGLEDRHLHLFASAVNSQSIDLSGLQPDAPEIVMLIREGAKSGRVRATGLDGADRLDAAALDRIAGDIPVRVQARTGSLWILNTAALREVLLDLPEPPQAFERQAGALTGRVWRGDAWLRTATPVPDLKGIGAMLARYGVTVVTDASVTTDREQAERIAAACATDMPQRIRLMGGAALGGGAGWSVDCRKVMLDCASLPPLDGIVATIREAREEGRGIAVHCVTHTELAFTLAALAAAGSRPGDRIEHGSLISPDCLPIIADLGLTVVSNPALIGTRGDRYLRDLPADDIPDLYRLRSVRDAGITLYGATDSPYGPLNPWVSIRSACERRTPSGALINRAECLSPADAMSLFLPDAPLSDGGNCDLAILKPGARIGIDEDPVAFTVACGALIYRCNASAQKESG